MTTLPAQAEAILAAMLASPPPLSPAQQRIIQRALTGSPAARAA